MYRIIRYLSEICVCTMYCYVLVYRRRCEMYAQIKARAYDSRSSARKSLISTMFTYIFMSLFIHVYGRFYSLFRHRFQLPNVSVFVPNMKNACSEASARFLRIAPSVVCQCSGNSKYNVQSCISWILVSRENRDVSVVYVCVCVLRKTTAELWRINRGTSRATSMTPYKIRIRAIQHRTLSPHQTHLRRHCLLDYEKSGKRSIQPENGMDQRKKNTCREEKHTRAQTPKNDDSQKM